MVAWLLRLILAGTFALAAITKLSDPVGFAGALRSYQLLPEVLVKPVAFMLPSAELTLALGLVLGLYPRLLPKLVRGLLLAFAGVVLYEILVGRSIHCGCFGSGETLSWKTLMRDLGLMGLAQTLIILDTPGLFRRRRVEQSVMGVVVAASLAVGLLVPIWGAIPYTVVATGSAVDEQGPSLGYAGPWTESLRLCDLGGQPVEVSLNADGRYLLLFVDVRCHICGDVGSWLERNFVRLPDVPTLIIVVVGATGAEIPASPSGTGGMAPLVAFTSARETVRTWGLRSQVLFDLEEQQLRRYRLQAVPAVLLIQRGCVVASFHVAKQTPIRHPDVLDVLARVIGVSPPAGGQPDSPPARGAQRRDRD